MLILFMPCEQTIYLIITSYNFEVPHLRIIPSTDYCQMRTINMDIRDLTDVSCMTFGF